MSDPKVEVITRRLCGGCQDLKKKLSKAGVEFAERDVETVDGLAAWAWYGAPALLPAVAIGGQLLPAAGNVDALFEAITQQTTAGKAYG